jgi:hypothetical protein
VPKWLNENKQHLIPTRIISAYFFFFPPSALSASCRQSKKLLILKSFKHEFVKGTFRNHQKGATDEAGVATSKAMSTSLIPIMRNSKL